MGQGTSTSASSGGLANLAGQYTTPMPDIVNQYMQNLSQQGLLDMPSFNTMFNSYKTVANRGADQQSAALNQSFGTMGQRYGSELLAAQRGLRQNTSQDLANQAAQYQSALRGQQFNEASGIAGMQYGASEAGMTRLFQDFLRQTSPPPGLMSIYGLSQGYGLPATVVG